MPVIEKAKSWYSTDSGRKKVRYFLASVVATLISQGTLFVTYTILSVGSAVECNLIATAVGAVPSYYLNRLWAWGKSGKSHLMKEVVPFWVLAFLGLGISLLMVNFAQHYSKSAGYSHLETGIVVNAASLLAFGIVWIAKYVIFDKLVFVD